MNYKLHIISISTTYLIKILVAVVIVYDLIICYEYKIVEVNSFQRFKDNLILKLASNTSLAVHLFVFIEN